MKRFLWIILGVAVITPTHQVTIGKIGKQKVNLVTTSTGSVHQVTIGKIGNRNVILVTDPQGNTFGRIGQQRIILKEVK